MSDELMTLVVKAQQGELSAFEALLMRYQKRVFYMILRVVGERFLADDITQEVFIKVHGALPRLKNPEHFQGWLFRIAINRAIDRKRSAKRESESCFLLDEFLTVAGPEGEESNKKVELDEMQTAIQEAIATLPDRQREVLSMTMDKNLSQEEIADVMDVPVGTVKSRLHHARKTLKEKLRRWIGGT